MRGTALARTVEAQGAKVPHGDRGLQLGLSTATSSRLPRVARNLDSIPVFQRWQQIHNNNHRAWANLTGKIQPTDYRFSTSVWEEAEPSKDMRRPGRGQKMRRQHAGRNKDIQSQLRRNSSKYWHRNDKRAALQDEKLRSGVQEKMSSKQSPLDFKTGILDPCLVALRLNT